MNTKPVHLHLEVRRKLVMTLFAMVACILSWRAMDLQLTNREFLQDHGDARYLRIVETAAHRGMITDRNGEPLAISTPVQSIWAQPRILAQHRDQWVQLAALLDTTTDHLEALILPRRDREFVYLKRHVEPQAASEVKAAIGHGERGPFGHLHVSAQDRTRQLEHRDFVAADDAAAAAEREHEEHEHGQPAQDLRRGRGG
jgi:cell division protein FtsI/penicillin-binding protein 2